MGKCIRFINYDGTIRHENTKYSYEIGEVISVNNSHNLYKCIDIINAIDRTIYCFKQGYKTISYDW